MNNGGYLQVKVHNDTWDGHNSHDDLPNAEELVVILVDDVPIESSKMGGCELTTACFSLLEHHFAIVVLDHPIGWSSPQIA